MNGSRSSRALLKYINKATDPFNLEPNLALNLEIADYINEKQGNLPREAALLLLKRLNLGNPTVAYLSLNLLDILVKNCGYPFHLQLASEDFLKRFLQCFPVHPPLRLNKIHKKILEMLEEWNILLCKNSRHRADFTRIHDMRELMAYRGYKFPKVDKDAINVMIPKSTLRSAQELAKEDRIAHEAKLQELLRRGTPMDLAEANALMKIIAGYEKDDTEDYYATASADIENITKKTHLVQRMLSGEHVGEESLEEAIDSLKACQTTVNRLLQEESEDEYYVSKLLELNDLIHSVLGQCNEQNVHGQPSEKMDAAVDSATSNIQSLSLIDFGDEPTQASPSAGASALSSENSSSTPNPVSNAFSLDKVEQKETSNSSSVFDLLQDPAFIPSVPAATATTASSIAQPSVSICKTDSLSLEVFALNSSNVDDSLTVRFKAVFSNNNTNPVSKINLQIAVVKSLHLELHPIQGAPELAPESKDALSEIFDVSKVPVSSESVKIRWRLSWLCGPTPCSSTGESVLPFTHTP
ncbi:hypothetical protein SJAG_03756 [Schizosaccharomyces japonicus yFS275]|uniref:Adaptin n=1 Tax=Schizosaccharomyces japonicus (strain yFS275 / FY16936) TaxID=402676 RepID=B6K2V6_SCHJY|nr:hypothetical protein SJAG_03756 [Schizosaccharomyces japonicus yFS275]EEB08596.1 hypothetical protein SJAG_03756 [Schizosaccharomyces japonicus yFS275]